MNRRIKLIEKDPGQNNKKRNTSSKEKYSRKAVADLREGREFNPPPQQIPWWNIAGEISF